MSTPPFCQLGQSYDGFEFNQSDALITNWWQETQDHADSSYINSGKLILKKGYSNCRYTQQIGGDFEIVAYFSNLQWQNNVNGRIIFGFNANPVTPIGQYFNIEIVPKSAYSYLGSDYYNTWSYAFRNSVNLNIPTIINKQIEAVKFIRVGTTFDVLIYRTQWENIYHGTFSNNLFYLRIESSSSMPNYGTLDDVYTYDASGNRLIYNSSLESLSILANSGPTNACQGEIPTYHRVAPGSTLKATHYRRLKEYRSPTEAERIFNQIKGSI